VRPPLTKTVVSSSGWAGDFIEQILRLHPFAAQTEASPFNASRTL